MIYPPPPSVRTKYPTLNRGVVGGVQCVSTNLSPVSVPSNCKSTVLTTLSRCLPGSKISIFHWLINRCQPVILKDESRYWFASAVRGELMHFIIVSLYSDKRLKWPLICVDLFNFQTTNVNVDPYVIISHIKKSVERRRARPLRQSSDA